MNSGTLRTSFTPATNRWTAVFIWALTWGAMLLFDAHMDLANKALILVLASAIAAIWSTPWFSVLACAGGVQAFNVAFVPPRGTFSVQLNEHLLLLVTMLATSAGVSLLMTRQRQLAASRHQALQAASAAREAAQSQALRNTLLAAIAHDHRTPLATILGAASSLHDQGERLSDEQRRRLAATIIEESSQLARLTQNMLQLARLDAPGRTLHLDWESCEELVGTAMRRIRPRDTAHRVRAQVEPDLPLLRCDAVLLGQLLDNLLDNALRYATGDGPVELQAARHGEEIVIAVRDRGPGIDAALRERIFDTFQRGTPPAGPLGKDAPARRGAGVGLAVCRAIAHAHSGDLLLRPRAGGGCSFELHLPAARSPVLHDVPAEAGDQERG